KMPIEEGPVVVDRLVDAAQVLVVVVLALGRRDVVVFPWRNTRDIRQRHHRPQLQRGRADLARWNHVPCKGQSRARINQLFAQETEVARALLCGGDDGLACQTAILAVPFVGSEEERLVSDYRAAQGPAELVELERRRLG